MTFPVATTEDLLRVWRDGMSEDYRTGVEFEDDGRGFDAIVGEAAIFARVEEALATTSQAYYLRPHSTQIRPEASGARYAVGEVSITRAPPAIGPIELDVGTRLVAYVHDVTGELIEACRYVLTAQASLSAGAVGPVVVGVRAERVGYQANLPAGRPLAFVELGRLTVPATVTAVDTLQDTPGTPDRFTTGLVGRYVRFVGGANSSTYPRRVLSVTIGATSSDPNVITVDGPALVLGAQTTEVDELGDLGLEIAMVDAFVDGRHGWEDAIGEERGVYRQAGETDLEYRARIESLLDVVSPGAIIRMAARILSPLGIPFRLIEAGDPEHFIGYAWGPALIGTGVMGSPVDIDFATSTRRFAIAVGALGLDDLGTDTDVDLGATDLNDVDGDAYTDGYPIAWTEALLRLYAAINEIKAAGVAWNILLDPIYF